MRQERYRGARRRRESKRVAIPDSAATGQAGKHARRTAGMRAVGTIWVRRRAAPVNDVPRCHPAGSPAGPRRRVRRRRRRRSIKRGPAERGLACARPGALSGPRSASAVSFDASPYRRKPLASRVAAMRECPRTRGSGSRWNGRAAVAFSLDICIPACLASCLPAWLACVANTESSSEKAKREISINE